MDIAELPAELRTLVEGVISGEDVTSAVAMSGRCQVLSDRLDGAVDAWIAEHGDEDEDEDGGVYQTQTVQLFDAPPEVEDNDMAHGHYVLHVCWGWDEYYIDITAAQFPELGYTGPVVRTAHGWA